LFRRAPKLSPSSPQAPSTPPAPDARERFAVLGHLPELIYALAAIVVVTALYGLAYSQASAFPKASSLVGHGIGIVGFILMLMTATLYSLRKLRTDARWGSTAAWLKFHMVTGLVGPYMVLLHTSMKFNGLAGLAMLLTVVVVVSGVVGRYLYTRVPRMAEGLAAAAGDADRESRSWLLKRRKRLATWHTFHVPLTWALFIAAFIHVVAALYYATLQR
jgi:cytochrome b561